MADFSAAIETKPLQKGGSPEFLAALKIQPKYLFPGNDSK